MSHELEVLNDKLIKLVQTLQNEVFELKEDTLINAQHINAYTQKNDKIVKDLTNNLHQRGSETGEFVQNLKEEHEKNNVQNYSEFIKNLLENDFIAKQNTLLESMKRDSTQKAPKTNPKSQANPLFVMGIALCLCAWLGILTLKVFG